MTSSKMSVTYAKGSIGVVIERNSGTVHTTTVHMFPVAYLAGIAVVFVLLLIWIRRAGKRSE